MQTINRILNTITMYRLLVYVLAIYVTLSLIFALTGKLVVSPTHLIISLILLIVAAYVTDRSLARFLGVPTNMESSLITALILFLILQPVSTVMSGVVLVVAGAISSASKFLLAWNGKHIFNPAAFAASVMSLTGLTVTTWWIGSTMFWPVTALLGLVIVYKIRRFPLVLTFGFIAVFLQAFLFVRAQVDLGEMMKHTLFASPLIFLATVMLTEPATMPPRRNLQMAYGAVVAVLYVMAWRLGPLIIYPEVALLLGNIFAFMVSPKFRVRLHLTEIQRISDRVYNYVFQPERTFRFLPGQYMEWTLAGVSYDSRGNRRTFTIASSPTESTVQLGMKYYLPASTYKAAFAELQPGDVVYASQLAGNFTLKGNERKKLVFVAGGIGITPFRSMVKYVTDRQLSVDITLLYAVSDPREFAYVRDLQAAAKVGVTTIPIVSTPGFKQPGVVSGDLSPELIAELVPDYDERIFYISGPQMMVDATKGYLEALHVHLRRIKTDHFSGY